MLDCANVGSVLESMAMCTAFQVVVPRGLFHQPDTTSERVNDCKSWSRVSSL